MTYRSALMKRNSHVGQLHSLLKPSRTKESTTLHLCCPRILFGTSKKTESVIFMHLKAHSLFARDLPWSCRPSIQGVMSLWTFLLYGGKLASMSTRVACLVSDHHDINFDFVIICSLKTVMVVKKGKLIIANHHHHVALVASRAIHCRRILLCHY